MSASIYEEIRQVYVGNAPAKAVLICLAMRADSTNREAWPSYAYIAEATDLSERTVMRALKSLDFEELGFLSKRRKSTKYGYKVHYYILPVKAWPSEEICRKYWKSKRTKKGEK